MATISNSEIDELRSAPKTELEQIYEHGINSENDGVIRNLAKTIDFLSSLTIEEAMKETYYLIAKRLTLFLGSVQPEKREKIIPNIRKLTSCFTNKQSKDALRSKYFKLLSREHRTILNHFGYAFQTFNFAAHLATVHLETNGINLPKAEPKVIIMSLRVSLQSLYKGDMRLIRGSIYTGRRQLVKIASTAHSKMYILAQIQTCILLRELVPEGGWTSRAQAARVIAPQLETHLRLHEIRTPNQETPGNVLRRVRAWLDKTPSVEAAYLENCPTPKT